MGVVYKAQDTKLDREVALKFLPASQLGTGDDQKRFEQEAKAAAKLSHANIATVFEINEHEGETFIAMEYVDGETLSEMVEKRPLKIKDAIKIAKQIAEGLHSAHEQGIVHRDIKSSNIMITAKRVVKIMDFGLAKVSKGSMVTKAGTTLGTISYMSPEQTQGEKVDHRSDIWSLGVVLYEMVSGQMPFKGDYESAIIYSIMNEDPEPLTAVRTGVPMDLEKIVNKLLAKEPGQRYQNVVELPVDLSSVSLQETQTSKMGSSAITDTISQKKKVTVEVEYSYKTILKALALVIPSVILTLVLRPGPPPPDSKNPNKMVVPLPETASHYFSNDNRMAISPDGENIVHLGIGEMGLRLFLKKASSFDMSELEGTANARSPFFSPDGRWIGYFHDLRDEIYKVSVDGSNPLRVTSISPTTTHYGATFASEQTIVFVSNNVLNRISESGGEAEVLTKAKSVGEQHLFPHMLPDGKTVLFTVGLAGGELNMYRLAIFSFGDEDYRIILDEEGYNGIYSPSGHILYGRSNQLMGLAFDLKDLTISGVPAPVLDNVNTSRTGGMSYAFSSQGTIAFVPGSETDDNPRSVFSVDLSGSETEFMDQKKEFRLARYSPDGKYVGFIIEEDNDQNIWMYHIEGGSLNQLTFYKGIAVQIFAWSPDSRTVAFATRAEDSSSSIYLKQRDGTGTAQKIYTAPETNPIRVRDWSSSGSEIVFTQANEGTGFDLLVYSFSDSSAWPYLASPALEVDAQFSPDGKWMAFMSNESGRAEVYVRPFPDATGGVWKISNGRGDKPLWSPDGQRIYFRNYQSNQMYAVDISAEDGFSKGSPRKIFDGNYFLAAWRRFDIHPDGENFIMLQNTASGTGRQNILVIQNFFDEINRLVPVEKN